MDILAQYDKQNPEQQQTPEKMYEDPSEDYGPIIRWVIKISGGRIQDIRHANMVLAGAAIIMIIITLVTLFGLPGYSATTIPLRSIHPGLFIK